MHITLKDYITNDTLLAQDVVSTYLQQAKTLNADYFSFVRFHENYIATHLDMFASRPLKAASVQQELNVKSAIFVSSRFQ
jgi:hypothetical protein